MIYFLFLIGFVVIWEFILVVLWKYFGVRKICVIGWRKGCRYFILYATFVLTYLANRLFSCPGGFFNGEFEKSLKIAKKIPYRSRNFFINLGIGLTVVFLLFFFHGNDFYYLKPIKHQLEAIENEDMDLAIYLHHVFFPIEEESERKIKGSEKDIPAFVFIDIDDKTHKDWGKFPFIPRDRLTCLIDLSIQAGAKLVIVDVDLSIPTPTTKDGLHDHDERLLSFLKEHAKKCEDERGLPATKCPSIILARTFYPSEEESANNNPPLKPRQTFLDKVPDGITKGDFSVAWGTVEFTVTEESIRHWSLWEPACSEELPQNAQQLNFLRGEVIPSVELLSVAMICREEPQDTNFQKGFKFLENELGKRFIPNCHGVYLPPNEEQKEFIICGDQNNGIKVSKGRDGVHQRVVYRMPWKLKKGAGKLKILMDRIDNKGNPVSILKVFSARELNSIKDFDNNFKDSIVVIGGSYTRGGDMHVTPLEKMPGGLILINAINSLLKYGEVSPIGEKTYSYGILWNVFFILLMTVAFMLGHSFRAMIISGGVIIFIGMPLSIWYIGEGVWLDFALPLMVIEYHHLLNEISGKGHGTTSHQEKCHKKKEKKLEIPRINKPAE